MTGNRHIFSFGLQRDRLVWSNRYHRTEPACAPRIGVHFSVKGIRAAALGLSRLRWTGK